MEILKKQQKEMECGEYINIISEMLDEKLNYYSGIKQEPDVPEKSAASGEDTCFYKGIDIRWKGDIHFEARVLEGYGWYFVSRDRQRISNLYHVHKFDHRAILCMQQLINDIERGRYHSKKTLKEQIMETVEKRGLTGYMNATKWEELLGGIRQDLKEIPLMYKTLFDEDEPKDFWTLAGDEDLEFMDTALIEWMKINPIRMEYEYQGALLENKVEVYDLEPELIAVLKKYNIPYGYLEDEKIYIIYGYK